MCFFKFEIVNFIHGDFKIFVFNKGMFYWMVATLYLKSCILNKKLLSANHFACEKFSCVYSIVSMDFVFKFNIVNFIHGDFEIFLFYKYLVKFCLSRLYILKFVIIKLWNYLC